MTTEKEYLQKNHDKLMTVINAAEQNTPSSRDIEIHTRGADPSASCCIPSHILKQLVIKGYVQTHDRD